MSLKERSHREGQGVPFSPMRFLLWGTLIAIGIPSALLVVLHLPFVQNAVIKGLIQAVERRAPLKVTVEGYRWWPLSRLSLNKLRIRISEQEFLECDQARLSYSLSLQQPYMHPEELNLEKPVIHIEKDSKGRWQIPRIGGLQSQEQKSGDLKETLKWLALPGLQVKIASGTILGRQNGQGVFTIREVTGTLSLRVESGPDGPRIKIELGQWQGNSSDPLLCLPGSGRFARKTATVESGKSLIV